MQQLELEWCRLLLLLLLGLLLHLLLVAQAYKEVLPFFWPQYSSSPAAAAAGRTDLSVCGIRGRDAFGSMCVKALDA